MLQLNMTKWRVFSKKNSLEPCLNFTNICALRKLIINALSQLFFLQSTVHGWLGLAMDPATYHLLEGVAFVTPNDPGPTPVYPQWAAPTVGRRGTNQLRLLERYLDVLVKHTTEIPPSTALVEVRP
jgi:hypothetical protein